MPSPIGVRALRATLNQKALGKFATLDEAALQKFAKLDDAVLAKFGSLRDANMIEAYGKLSQEHLEKLARLDKNVLEKFAGWAHDPPARPGFNNILENIAKQDAATIDLIASLKPKPLALSENAAKVVDTVRVRIAGSEYQIDHDVVEHILQRHSREFWEGSVKAEQSFLPAGFGPDEIVDVIRDVLRKNEGEVARIGVGYGPLPLTESHGITWQLGLNGGHVGQLYPKF